MAKISGNEIKPGMVIEYNGTVWRAMKTMAVKPGKGGAFNQVEMRNLFNGSKANERFRSSETVERVRLEQKNYQYLFDAGEAFAFMDTETFEQIEIAKDFIGDDGDFLQDGMTVEIEFYGDKPIGVAIPDQVTVTVEETEPVVKGQTAANSYKPATCDNGVRVTVPPFIGVGERIIVQTSDRTYLRRAD